ncbi:MAG: thiol oxidoreductase [Gracilimonas sp.]|uniref:di-heme oxidoredictase family protein n=1 Tax=Gracilimonas sp. TaxID=1974203 RepID=UPI0019CB2C71|nr:di-heme oxidoredictase family protein [Gracilimonas sp.]MBD3617691.1 thiol oxidoreductase [Gracilimonas sp.]
MKYRIWIPVLYTCFLLLMIGCDTVVPEAPAEKDLLDGPIPGLTHEEQDQFLKGDIAFNDDVFTPQTGLGPTFVATSCGSCHPGDGKGHPSTSLIRFGQTEPNSPINAPGAPQLQNRAIPGYQPEKLPEGVPSMKMTPPAVTGLGLLAALTDQQILENTDPNDEDGDGISGVPNYVTPPDYFIPEDHHQPENGKYIGRFGKKASTVNLLHQTATAYNQDIGVTSTFEPLDVYSGLTTDPEVSDQVVRDVVFYLKTLKAPIQRKPQNPLVLKGKGIFTTIQCSSCHTPQWTTPETDIAALSNKTFYPYTDLLLHDMGPELDDGATEGSAETYEWRTPPLWGLGLSPDSQGGKYFLMHDGRAESIEEAILMHGGEAQNSRDQFQLLSPEEKEALIMFLESL